MIHHSIKHTGTIIYRSFSKQETVDSVVLLLWNCHSYVLKLPLYISCCYVMLWTQRYNKKYHSPQRLLFSHSAVTYWERLCANLCYYIVTRIQCALRCIAMMMIIVMIIIVVIMNVIRNPTVWLGGKIGRWTLGSCARLRALRNITRYSNAKPSGVFIPLKLQKRKLVVLYRPSSVITYRLAVWLVVIRQNGFSVRLLLLDCCCYKFQSIWWKLMSLVWKPHSA